MGIEIAKEANDLGANVTLIIGPTKQDLSQLSNINIIQIESAQEMFEAVDSKLPTMNLGIFSAAVADYRVADVAEQKIKKNSEIMTLDLVKNKDILKYAGENKEKYGYKLVGFALETENGEENAKKKLVKKNLDYIVLNTLEDEGAGFSHDTNKISILEPNNKITRFELKSKLEVAKDILKTINHDA